MMQGTQFQSPPPSTASSGMTATTTAAIANDPNHHSSKGKRKADSLDNERLSKRLSLLNIEQNGSKLYVPVEGPSRDPPPPAQDRRPRVRSQPLTNYDDANDADAEDNMMRLDDSKHKVYIYNIDDELSSSDAESDDGGGKLVFLPDIEKHLKQQSRIPRHILANDDGELAGMQLVLYREPRSLSLPEEQDGVRKAIIDSRRRLREKQARERDESPHAVRKLLSSDAGDAQEGDAMDMD